ncbi:hypothetical protein RvY_02686 [Ramazzottius varieornatus]|uniref:Uncharacterized protein n=1 Tax=Ramazzottius varieornatus TaxID=947166 RepID=A0A1D1UVQ2_RAMVA|nr:hypothetical protein RvY_02686 [Ramazzottius varieornatus]
MKIDAQESNLPSSSPKEFGRLDARYRLMISPRKLSQQRDEMKAEEKTDPLESIKN